MPPLLWSLNAIIGRLIHDMIPPITLNFVRWILAFLILLPLAYPIFKPGSGLWKQGKRYLILGLLAVGLYNALQYLALKSSSPINVTLVASGMPIWMMIVGSLFFGKQAGKRQIGGGVLSIAGVLIVLSHGDLQQLLSLHLVPGDILMIAATIAWSFYSWMLTQSPAEDSLRQNWAHFLLAQITYGLLWSGAFSAGEWAFTDFHIIWSGELLAAILFIAIGPAILAYRCWNAGVQRAGPNIAGFFSNLTPLFTALLSSAILGETPRLYHAIAFLCIVSGIVVSSKQ
jgi:drug/metabolite transporter (DMT)-like permease